MIDSSYTETLYDVIQQFREYITQNHGTDSKTAQAYIRIADDFQIHVRDRVSSVLPELAIQEYYSLTVGVPPFEAPPSKSKERYARAIRMIHDILHNEEPKRRYVNCPLRCPEPYQDIPNRYEIVMKDDKKSRGTIRTRSGRMNVCFVFLADRECVALGDITPELFADYVSSLKDRYSSQGKASILYTIRNFVSYDKFSDMLSFDPLPFLTGIHSKKHERLSSFYTADEVKRILNAVDRSTGWRKTAYLMMLLACMYGLRSSDTKDLGVAVSTGKDQPLQLYNLKHIGKCRFPLRMKFCLHYLTISKMPAQEQIAHMYSSGLESRMFHTRWMTILEIKFYHTSRLQA